MRKKNKLKILQNTKIVHVTLTEIQTDQVTKKSSLSKDTHFTFFKKTKKEITHSCTSDIWLEKCCRRDRLTNKITTLRIVRDSSLFAIDTTAIDPLGGYRATMRLIHASDNRTI